MKIFSYFFFIFYGAAVCAAQPFLELNDLFSNQEFMYEQVMAPPALRKFFIPVSLILEGAHPSVQWCDRIKALLSGMTIPASMHYISRSYAPFTYAAVMSMALSIDVPPPLIFLADKNQYHSTKVVDVVLLGGEFYALIFNQAFIARRTEKQLRALVARELADISRARQQTKNRLKTMSQFIVGAAFFYGAYSCGALDLMRKYWVQVGLFSAACGTVLKLAEIGDYFFNKINDRDLEQVAAKAFSDSFEVYKENLKAIQSEEAARAQHREFQYYAYVLFLLKKIDEMSEMLSPYVLYFLKNELMYFAQISMKKPVCFTQTGFSNAE